MLSAALSVAFRAMIGLIGLLVAGTPNGHAQAQEVSPANGLLRLLPEETAVAVVVEDLSRHWIETARSGLTTRIQELPAVQAWQRSAAGKLDLTRRQFRAALGIELEELRDGLLGQASVLALVPEVGRDPEAAHGLLLVRVPDQALFERLIDRLNDLERRGGALTEVAGRSRGGRSYRLRRFAPGTKPDEAYVILDGQVVAWANSEALIQGLIDRVQEPARPGEPNRWQQERRSLPTQAVVSLLVDSRFLRRALRAGLPDPYAPDPTARLVLQALEPIGTLGLALWVQDGLTLQAHESRVQPIEPERSPGEPLHGLLSQLPAEPLALVAGQLDWAGALKVFLDLLNARDRARVENLLDAISGVMLGQDLRLQVLPRLGTAAAVLLSRPDNAGPVWLCAFEYSGAAHLRPALANMGRTILALLALDENLVPEGTRPEFASQDGLDQGRLAGLSSPLVYRLSDRWLALGTAESALSGMPSTFGSPTEPAGLARLQAERFPHAYVFAMADLGRLRRLASTQRARLIESLAARASRASGDIERDLDGVLGLMGLFEHAWLAHQADPEGTGWRQTLRLSSPE